MSAASTALKALLEKVPLSEKDQTYAEELVKKCTTQELISLGLGAPNRPVVPKGLEKLPMRQRLQSVQKVISSVEYNHSPGYFYNVSKDRPWSRVMDTAREVVREALPIKCIEAVFLGAFLTAGWEELDRYPVGFKSMVNGQTYRHIVLVVHHVPSHKWGALGISRRTELMDKDLVYDSLADVISDYKKAYETWWHTLQKIRLGLPCEHDVYYTGPVCWRYCSITPTKHSWDHCRNLLEKFAGSSRQLAQKFRMLGYKPPALERRPSDAPSLSGMTKMTSTPASGASASNFASPARRRPAASSDTRHPASPARRRPPPASTPPPSQQQQQQQQHNKPPAGSGGKSGAVDTVGAQATSGTSDDGSDEGGHATTLRAAGPHPTAHTPPASVRGSQQHVSPSPHALGADPGGDVVLADSDSDTEEEVDYDDGAD